MELSRTKSIIPTSLALYEQCPALFLYGREQFQGKLASANVSSIKGNLLHGLIESYSISGQMPCNSTVDFILEQQQDQYKWLADIAQWPESWTLRKLVGAIERGNLLLSARQKIRAYQSHIRVQNSSIRSAGLAGGVASEANPYGIELEYRHEELELKGRADLTYGEGPVATIIDFKSGQTKCMEGKLKREYYLQLGAYGLMLQQFSTAKTIVLKAEGSDTMPNEVALAFDEDHRATIINLCRNIISIFPREKAVRLEPLEKYGDHCKYCPGKGVCRAFNSALSQPSLYPEISRMGSVIAHDVKIQSTAGGWLNLSFKAITGKEGRVVNIPSSRLGGLENGNSSVLHNLKWAGKFSDGSVYNFFVADPSSPANSSFDFSCNVVS